MIFMILDSFSDEVLGLYDTEQEALNQVDQIYKRDLDQDRFSQGQYQILSVQVIKTEQILY